MSRRQVSQRQGPRRQVRRAVEIRHYAFDWPRVGAGRQALGLSQSEFARRIGVTLRTAQRWEHGEGAPQPLQLAALANVLGVDPDDLYVQEEPAA